MKVLVLNPSSRVTKNVVRDVLYGCWCKGKRIGGGTVPPFSLLSVATVLKQAGFHVTFIDALAELISIEQLKLKISDYDVVIISTSTMSFNEDAQTLLFLKQINPRLISVVFGSQPTFMPDYSLEKKGVDVIILGEPEYVLRELISNLQKGSNDWKRLNGLGFKENGKKCKNPKFAFVENLDELPFLDTSMLPKDIHYFNPLVKRLPYITLTTSSGCPGKCTFCTAPLFYGKKVRFQSVKRVLAEVRHHLENGFKEIYFRDETFTFNKRRTQEICRGIIEQGLDVSWICNSRVGLVNREDMQIMKKAGCHLIKFGVESGVQEILDNVQKGIQVEMTRQTFSWTKEVGLDTHAHVMLGMPGETEQTIEQTIAFAKEIEPTTVTFGICTPYPGTPLFQEVAKKCPQIRDGTEVDLSKLHTQGFFNEYFTNLNAEYLGKAVRQAYRSFYLRPGYLFRSLRRSKGLNEVKRLVLAGTRVIDFALRGED